MKRLLLLVPFVVPFLSVFGATPVSAWTLRGDQTVFHGPDLWDGSAPLYAGKYTVDWTTDNTSFTEIRIAPYGGVLAGESDQPVFIYPDSTEGETTVELTPAKYDVFVDTNGLNWKVTFTPDPSSPFR
jgi:hypothetical protein